MIHKVISEVIIMPDKKKILVINPGSTSTKVSLFLDEDLLFEKNIFHDAPELLRRILSIID